MLPATWRSLGFGLGSVMWMTQMPLLTPSFQTNALAIQNDARSLDRDIRQVIDKLDRENIDAG